MDPKEETRTESGPRRWHVHSAVRHVNAGGAEPLSKLGASGGTRPNNLRQRAAAKSRC